LRRRLQDPHLNKENVLQVSSGHYNHVQLQTSKCLRDLLCHPPRCPQTRQSVHQDTPSTRLSKSHLRQPNTNKFSKTYTFAILGKGATTLNPNRGKWSTEAPQDNPNSQELKHTLALVTHSSTLAWKLPWMKEPGRLQSMGALSWTRLSDFTFTFHFHALEKEMATHSSVLAWRIPLEAWWAAVYGVAQSRTWLTWLSSSSSRASSTTFHTPASQENHWWACSDWRGDWSFLSGRSTGGKLSISQGPADVMKYLLVFLCLSISVSIPQCLLLRSLHIPFAFVILYFGKRAYSVYPGLDQLHPLQEAFQVFCPSRQNVSSSF